MDTPPGVGQVMSVPVSTWLLVSSVAGVSTDNVRSKAATLLITQGYTILTSQIQRKERDAFQ